MDKYGKVWQSWYPEDYELSESDKEIIRALAKEEESGMILSEKRIKSGVLSAYRQEETGLVVYTIVPNSVLAHDLKPILLVMVGIYLFVIVMAVVLSIYFSNRFSKPIKIISKAMTGFDGTDFSKTIEIDTRTELDQIGQSYNEMLGNIEALLNEIKLQERELRTSELQTLISQINPHFLYNTLDNIYMLARMNGEETTMKMIQALSKYLRLSLSKGSDIVTVEDELENVKSYMEIQQIRNKDLFAYEINCEINEKETRILKLILQPLVENAIKYGFCEIYEGGLIRIQIREENQGLRVEVYNSGLPMKQEIADQINAMSKKPLLEIKDTFAHKHHGYGIFNILTRLRLKYGEEVGFAYEVEEEGTRCIIWIPYVEE
jgi:sensor histidine kinase YesM